MADFTRQESSMDMDMDSHSHSGSSTSSHAMAFHVSISDPLFSTAWTPETISQYAGTVIFLIALGFIHRFLVAWKSVLESKWAKQTQRGMVVVAGKSQDSETENLKQNSITQTAVAPGWSGKPWRWDVELPRSSLQVVNTGIGYLLMLAVMTFNTGYFMAVLSGVFLGEMAWGRWGGGGH